jgi:hypothetical protein
MPIIIISYARVLAEVHCLLANATHHGSDGVPALRVRRRPRAAHFGEAQGQAMPSYGIKD